MHFRSCFVSFVFFAGFVLSAKSQSHNNRLIRKAIDTMANVTQYVHVFENFGNKMIGSVELEKTANWLDSFYNQLNFNVQRDSFTYLGHKLCNIIAEPRVSIPQAPWILVISHYDTRNGPGANDNGSGVASTLEIARAISTLPRLKCNLRFIHFSSEEFGLAGSYHYVQNTLQERIEEVKLVMNLDQLGGTRGADNNHYIYCERNPSDPFSVAFTDTLAMMVRSYSALIPVTSTAFASDYIPFQQEGYVINGLYQFSAYPYYHTSGDKIENMDTFWLQEAAKAALAYVLYLVAPDEWALALTEQFSQKHSAQVFYRTSSSELIVSGDWYSAEILDITGKMIWNGWNDQEPVKVDFLPLGPYLVRLNMQDGSVQYGRWIKN